MVSSTEFESYGFSSKMGPQLRQFVEQQLREDLLCYGIAEAGLHFDWSNSCLEGHDTAWLDGHLENYSGIALLDQQGQAVVEGWMDFILTDGLLLIYWDHLTKFDSLTSQYLKRDFGIPPHIWSQIPTSSQPKYLTERMRNLPFGSV